MKIILTVDVDQDGDISEDLIDLFMEECVDILLYEPVTVSDDEGTLSIDKPKYEVSWRY